MWHLLPIKNTKGKSKKQRQVKRVSVEKIKKHKKIFCFLALNGVDLQWRKDDGRSNCNN